MNKKILILEKNGKSQSVPLDKEKILIGRDSNCDVSLDDAAVSRKHAVILIQYDQVYIENVSSSGQILRGDEPVEYVQMDEEAEFHIGPYVMFWRNESEAREQPIGSKEFASGSEDVSQLLGEENGPRDPNATVPSTPEDLSQEDPFAAVKNEQEAGEISAENGNQDLQLQVMNPPQDQMPNQGDMPADGALADPNAASADDFDMGDAAPVDTAAATRLTSLSAKPILKILKGEEVGRQIKLDYGFQWVVGRSPRCHVQINNSKLSRQHFKIYKVGNSYRLQDLGSSHGTKLNGVTVTDAPLQPFDAIQAGPVEVQYLLVDAKLSDDALAEVGQAPQLDDGLGIPQQENLLNAGSSEVLENTDFAPPVPYSATPYQGQEVPRENVSLNFDFANVSSADRAPSEEEIAQAKGPISKVVIWYKAQPKPRQVAFLLLLVAAVSALVLAGLGQEETAPEMNVVNVEDPKDPKQAATASSAATPALTQSSDISAEFDLLPEEQKLRIRELYAKAERAKAAKNWQEAFDLTSEITRSVKRYKKTTDILLEAQSYVTEKSIGNLSPGLKDNELAQKEVAEQVKVLCTEGEKAIKEERWEDAQETYRKAFNLDPKNGSCAEKGYRAAFAKDPKLLFTEVPKVVEAPKVDPEQEKIEKARADFSLLLNRYVAVKEKINQGRASDSLPELYDLKSKVSSRKMEYSNGSRAPASVRDELMNESSNLLVRIDEGISAMKSKLKADYQVQLADAEQFIANKSYSTAREIYDRILEKDPQFDEVQELRERLYSKIIAEARNKYQEGIIYESVGDVDNAIEGYEKTRELLANVDVFTATEYYAKAGARLNRLKR